MWHQTVVMITMIFASSVASGAQSELKVVKYWNSIATEGNTAVIAVKTNGPIQECIWTSPSNKDFRSAVCLQWVMHTANKQQLYFRNSHSIGKSSAVCLYLLGVGQEAAVCLLYLNLDPYAHWNSNSIVALKKELTETLKSPLMKMTHCASSRWPKQ